MILKIHFILFVLKGGFKQCPDHGSQGSGLLEGLVHEGNVIDFQIGKNTLEFLQAVRAEFAVGGMFDVIQFNR